jgi:uncharacterized protein YeaO (DUF488 family)
LTRYFAELDAKKKLWWPLVQSARKERVTLLYSSSDPVHNCAAALQRYLLAKVSFLPFRARNTVGN